VSPAPAAPSGPGQGQPSPGSIAPTGGTSSSSYSATRPRQPAQASRSQNRVRITRLKASPRRFRSGARQRGIRITFRLSAPGRVVFLVRGPAPSCEVVGRFTVRGRRGTNRVRFKGRVGRRTLAPGTYALTARPAGRGQRTRPVVVTVGTGSPQELVCSGTAEGNFFGTAPFFDGDESSTATAAATTDGDATPGKRDRGVLPAISRKIRELPKAIPTPAIPRPGVPGDTGSPPMILGLAALALLALSGLLIIAYVIRFLRGPHTKSA
jgi:hypothetical protein